jgi:hypothetical protein
MYLIMGFLIIGDYDTQTVVHGNYFGAPKNMAER